MPQLTARRAARDSWKPRAQPLERAVLPAPQARQVLRPLQEACSAKAAEAVAVGLPEMAVQAVQAVVALVAAVARVAAAHTQQVLVGLVAMVGHWYWSSDDGQIRCC